MTAGSSMEVELKYRLNEASAAERFLALEELAGFHASTPTRSTQMEDRYVDTADGALARAGFAARLRLSAKETIISIKSTARRSGPGAAHRREELEGPADRRAGPRDWPASAARSLILEQCGDAPLVEVVTIRQLRRKRNYERDGTVVELSVDEVDVVARSRVVRRFVELELEVVGGDDALLADLEAQLAADTDLAPADGSKLETALAAIKATSRKTRRGATDPAADDVLAAADTDRGHLDDASGDADAVEPAESGTTDVGSGGDGGAVVDDVPVTDEVAPPDTRLVVGKTPGVLAEDTVAEAGRKVLRFHLARMLAREAGTREGSDPEDLHAMRVATRRQRAAWRVFGDAFRHGRTRDYRGRLRQVATRLGAVRDLDVLLEAADAYRAELPVAEQRALEPLLSSWRAHREDARVLLLRELDSDGYRRWVDDYREFVRTEGVAVRPVGPTQPHRVRDTAASRILNAYEQVRAYEPVLRWSDVETLHDLRIAGKWLRYTLEFVREPLGPESAALISRVTALQDHLGLMHDADVAAHLARAFLVEHGAAVSPLESAAIGRYLVEREREVARLRRSVGPSWRGVSGIGFRRTLGRTLASL